MSFLKKNLFKQLRLYTMFFLLILLVLVSYGYYEAKSNPNQILALGKSYWLQASGDKESYVKAVSYFKKAAEKGHPQAQFLLASAYDHGLGVSENKAMALKWYRKACQSGYEDACTLLGLEAQSI